VIHVEEHRLIKNIVFRLVRRHIAGFTMNSALNAVRYLNGDGMNTTLTFLSEHVSDPIKARYNANTYVQVIKQISRLHLNSSVSLRLSQIGYALGNGSADRLLDDILDAARSGSSTVWLEGGLGVTHDELMAVYNDRRAANPNLGVEIPISYYSRMDGIIRSIRPRSMVRMTSHPYMAESAASNRSNTQKGMLNRYMSAISLLLKKSQKVCIHEPDEKLMARIASSSNGHKKDLIFGVPFGYSKRRVKRLMKMKVNLDVYVPYGKDWSAYAIYGLASGRLHGIATTLLDGERGGAHGS
jgi:proline dehydrogenase